MALVGTMDGAERLRDRPIRRAATRLSSDDVNGCLDMLGTFCPVVFSKATSVCEAPGSQRCCALANFAARTQPVCVFVCCVGAIVRRLCLSYSLSGDVSKSSRR